MSKIFHVSVLLLAVVILGSCGGSGRGGTFQVNVSWNANHDKSVNTTGGGYTLYYSQTNGFNVSSVDAQKLDIPYVSGSTAPTSTTLNLPTGTWYLRLSAYGISNGSTAQTSAPCDQIAVNVGG